jgi:hypothetical protein
MFTERRADAVAMERRRELYTHRRYVDDLVVLKVAGGKRPTTRK